MTPVSDKIFHASQCGICFAAYEPAGNQCALLKCGHIFHSMCINKWTKQTSHCPICRHRTFMPLIPKEALKEALAGGMVAAKFCATGSLMILVIFVQAVVADYFFEKPISNGKEVIVLLDGKRPDTYLKLLLVTGGMVLLTSLFFLGKEVHKKRNQKSEDVATLINYKP